MDCRITTGQRVRIATIAQDLYGVRFRMRALTLPAPARQAFGHNQSQSRVLTGSSSEHLYSLTVWRTSALLRMRMVSTTPRRAKASPTHLLKVIGKTGSWDSAG